MIQPMDVPSGFKHMEWIAWSGDFEIDGDWITIVVEPQSGKQQTFILSMKALIALDQEKWNDDIPAPLILKNDDAQIVANQFTLSINDKGQVDLVNIEGIMFTK